MYMSLCRAAFPRCTGVSGRLQYLVPRRCDRSHRKMSSARASTFQSLSFELSSTQPHFPNSSPSPRLGNLQHGSRKPIQTPHYIALSSRGTVPHITPDVMQDQMAISTLYAGFEDYAELLPKPPPLLSTYNRSRSPLRKFIALPQNTLLVLGPRRHPCLRAPQGNNYTAINVCTSVGFKQMEVAYYLDSAQQCGADILVAAVDVDLGVLKGRGEPGDSKGGGRERGRGVEEGFRRPGVKRRDHMVERSGAWLRALLDRQLEAEREELNGPADGNSLMLQRPSIWAPILPLEPEIQLSYLDRLEEAASADTDADATPTSGGILGGLVLYENASIDAIPSTIKHLPRLALTDPITPAEVLDAVSLGIDLVALPFITRASEAGVAMEFEFPISKAAPGNNKGGDQLPLGWDLWDSAAYARDPAPLVSHCTCYACRNHSRAYVNHLLQAKEMLAWVLLQVHNHHVVERFFEGVRASIGAGTFDEDVKAWKMRYASEWPEFIGEGPRLRGYQSTSIGPLPTKMNKAPYTKLDTKTDMSHRSNDRKGKLAEGIESKPLNSNARAVDLEEVGFAQLYE